MVTSRTALATFSLLLALTSTSFSQGSNVNECGAVTLKGDVTGVTDSSPALNAALEELAKCGGGTLEIGHGKFKLATTVTKNFLNRASKITIRGQGSNSQVIFATGPDADGLVLQNLEDLTIQGVTFVGSPNFLTDDLPNPAAGADVFRALLLQSILRARIQNNMFYGIAAPTPGGAIIKAIDSFITVEHNQFLGSAASQSGGAYGGVIMTDDHIGVRVVNNSFFDYGVLNGVYYSKTPLVWSLAWVILMNPNSATAPNARTNNPVEIAYNQFDEGAVFAVFNNPESGPIVTQHMKLAYNTMNVGTAGGYYLRRIKHLEITGGWAGFRPLGGSYTEVDAIKLQGVQFVTIRDFETDSTKSATRLSVDSGTSMLRILDSQFGTIVNHAKAWRIEASGKIISGPGHNGTKSFPPDN